MEAHHIELTSPQGATKWVHNITSHTPEEILDAWEKSELLTVTDRDGCDTALDLEHVFVIRFQDETVHRRRNQEAKKNGRRRHSQPVRRQGFPPAEKR